MRVALIGCGNQGTKRYKVAGEDIILAVDPAVACLDKRSIPYYDDLYDASFSDFDAALVCTPDEPKQEIVLALLQHGKHVLVEKPFEPTDEIIKLATEKNLVCYTAYNHRFEPNIIRMKELIDSGELGKLYYCRMFYGFGTAIDVKGTWRDRDLGCVTEIGSHLFDLSLYWFPCPDVEGQLVGRMHELDNAFDNFTFVDFHDNPELQLEGSWISWKNTFTVDLYGEKGSAHIDGLKKWGRSRFIHRTRKLPSGVPDEEQFETIGPDQTWPDEYEHFKELCRWPLDYADERAAYLQRDLKIAKLFKSFREDYE